MNPGHLSKDLIKEKGSDSVTILGNKDWGEEMARAKAPKGIVYVLPIKQGGWCKWDQVSEDETKK